LPVFNRPEQINQAYHAFIAAYPDYAATQALDVLRAREYSRLDRLNQVYLDYTGGGLYADSQLNAHMELLKNNVFGNPHSNNPTSLAMTERVEQARACVLEFFNADPAEYLAIFTLNASGALKLVGEAYPFRPGGRYLLTYDNHNSVNGIREFARTKGATYTYMPVVQPEMRVDYTRLDGYLSLADPAAHNLFAFPAQSNFSGVQHSLEMIDQAHQKGWDVLVDAAAFAPTNRLDLGVWKPDFVPLSFYKIFGYPTGVGCLLARKDALKKLERPWFAGGTITIASVQGDGHFLAEGVAGFEDGTISYVNLPAVETGLRFIAGVGIDLIHTRVMALAGWLLDSLASLRHSSGKPLVKIHGPQCLDRRGGTVTVSFFDRDGRALDDRRIEELANQVNISLRTGCFCNPGAGEVAHGLTPEIMGEFFKAGKSVSFRELHDAMESQYGKSVSTVRVSVGIATNFADVYRFLCFVQGLLDKTVEDIGKPEYVSENCRVVRDSS